MASPARTAEKWIDAFNKKQLDKLMALYAKNCKNAQPHLPAPLKGVAATEKDLGGFLRAFPNGKMKATVVIVKGDTVAMEWTFTGTHTGPLEGPNGTLPPTGKKVTVKGAEFTRHDANGLIVDERGYFDLANFMAQLGIGAPPA